jgi:hypothetical protein
MLGFRELESSGLYAGLGVQLIDEFASVPSANFEAPPLGWTTIDIDIDDGGGVFRPLDPAVLAAMRTPSGIVWYPWLERHADARGLAPRNYRARVSAGAYTPRYTYDSGGVIIAVAPYDDVTPPASVPAAPAKILLLPNATYPFAPGVPVLRGLVVDGSSAPVPNALVSWVDATLQTDSVLTDADGEFSLPMRRAALNTPIDIHAERPGRSGDTIVRIPQDVSIFHTILIS